MRDLAIKYAILCHQQRVEVPFRALVRDFSECEPQAMFNCFKRYLSAERYGVLRFGFPDKALADIIQYEQELVLTTDPPGLAFVKASLDVESFRLAGGVTKEFSVREQEQIDSLSAWLVDATRPLFKESVVTPVGAPRAENTRMMYKELLKLYSDKYRILSPDALFQLSSLHAMSAFTNSMTVDALYKADAARILFGERSAYYHAWLHQKMFRNLISTTVTQFIRQYAA